MIRQLLLPLFDFNTSYFYVKVLFVLYVLLKLISMRQSSKIKLHYNRSDPLMREFVQNTKIGKLIYRPYWFSVTPLMQSLTFLVAETWLMLWWKDNLKTEIIMAEDGGTLGIRWAHDETTKSHLPNAAKSQ